jgi:hypothetical protein
MIPTRRLMTLAVMALVVPLGLFGASSRADEDGADKTPPPPELTYFDGSDWVHIARHSCWAEGAGATVAGSATATFKAKLGGPKTYVVIAGSASEVTITNPKPRFRMATDKTGAQRVQLAEFDVKDENRRTTIERGKSGTVFTKSVGLEVTRVAEGFYELKPTKSLQPGEYALATTDTDPVADFTVIAKGY